MLVLYKFVTQQMVHLKVYHIVFLSSMLTTYHSLLAVIMPYTNTTSTNPKNSSPNLNPNCAVINEKHDLGQFSGRCDLLCFFVHIYNTEHV